MGDSYEDIQIDFAISVDDLDEEYEDDDVEDEEE